MSIEITVLISAVSVAFAIFFGLKNSKRADVKDIERKATERAETNYKLDEISRNVTDIKYDISSTKKSVTELTERMTKVEACADKAHLRIDALEKKEAEK